MQTEKQIKPYGYIYKITNKINNKPYIGQTTLIPQKRWNNYKTLNCKKQPKLYNALKKYGVDNFIFEVIDNSATNQISLNQLEEQYIQKYDSIKMGYNNKHGGSYGKHTQETKQNISKSQIGKKLSDDTKCKISNANKGGKQTPEIIAKRFANRSHKYKCRNVI